MTKGAATTCRMLLRVWATRPEDQTPTLPSERALASVARFKKRLAAPRQFSEAAFRKIDNKIWNLRVATLGEERARTRSAEDGKRSPVEVY